MDDTQISGDLMDSHTTESGKKKHNLTNETAAVLSLEQLNKILVQKLNKVEQDSLTVGQEIQQIRAALNIELITMTSEISRLSQANTDANRRMSEMEKMIKQMTKL